MKKMLLSLATCVIMATLVHAQTEKGDWLVGGLFQLNTAKNNTHIGLTPMGGKFVVNNLAVGADINLDYTKSGTDKVTQFGIGPFARYYFLKNKVRPIIQVDVNFLSTKSKGTGYSSTNNGTNYFLGGGLAYFVNDNVSIEGLAGYDHTKYSSFDGSGGFMFTIGFQVYLHATEMAHLKGQ